MNISRYALACLILCSALTAADTAATLPAAPPPKHFVIVLHVAPRLHDDKAWMPEDNAAVGAHFQRLKAATAAGQVILAGRTNESLDKTFGLVVFTAADEAAAREFMLADPCVIAGVMTAEVHPYALALRAK